MDNEKPAVVGESPRPKTPLRIAWETFSDAPLLFAVAGVLIAIVGGLGVQLGLPFLFRTDRLLEAFWGGFGVGWIQVEVAGLAIAIATLENAQRKGSNQRLWAGLVAGFLLALAALAVFIRLTPLGRWPYLIGLAVGAATLSGIVALLLPRAHRRTPQMLSRHMSESALTFQMQATATVIALAALILYVALLIYTRLFDPPNWGVPPGWAVCVALAWLLAAYSWFAVKLPRAHNWVIAAVLALMLGVSGVPGFKHRFEKIDYDAPEKSSKARVTLRSDDDALKAWAGNTPRPLVVLSVAGGGIRAALWTAVVLGALEDAAPAFPYHVRIVTGSSGGMVGAAHYVATLQPPGSTSNHASNGSGLTTSQIIDDMAKDSLAPLVRRLVFRDLLPSCGIDDRGWALERSFERNTGGALEKAFASLADGEAGGWRPSLLVSPMIVEDGRRMLISNLDLEHLTRARGAFLARETAPHYSVSAQQFFKLLPYASGFKLSSAVRASATFPYVTPAPTLPLDPPVRLVDAGYYDEPGVDLSALWILAHAKELRALASKVILIQVRDGPDQNGRETIERKTAPWYCRALHGISTPIEGGFRARSASMAFRNDGLLQEIDRRLNGGGGEFFTTALFEYKEKASLSWRLTSDEKDKLRAGMDDKGLNAATLARVKNLLSAGAPPPD